MIKKLYNFNYFNNRLIFCEYFILIFFFLALKANAQEAEIKAPKKFKLPIVSAGVGLLNFSGDVGYSRLNQPLTAHSGFQIEIQPQTEKRLSYSLFFLSGKIIGDEKSFYRSLNFSSSFFSEGLMLRYDFLNRKRTDQIIIPFLTAGVEYIVFRSRTDLRDKDGKYYQYWKDGTIRDIAENDILSDQAVVIYRDYNYESDLRDANLDGFGKYSTSTWGVPIGGGIRFRMSDRCALNFSSVCHLMGTDYFDGVTAESKGNRQGNDKNDKVFFTSVSFRFALSSQNEKYNSVDFNALVNEDADGDGIPDLRDDSSGTPKNNAVSIDGKPFDNDNDGIPDYRDKEAGSASDAVVNEEGVTITEEMIEEKFRKDSLAALPAVIEYIKSYDKLLKRNPDAEKKWMLKNTKADKKNSKNPVPLIYRKLDLDVNGIITPKEIGLAIDDYLAKRSKYTVSEFFDLIDFFFSQN